MLSEQMAQPLTGANQLTIASELPRLVLTLFHKWNAVQLAH